MIILLVRTAGTPTSTVAGSASPSAKPTGKKSQPTCGLIANKAGIEFDYAPGGFA